MDSEHRIVELLEGIQANQQRQLDGLQESLRLQREQFEIARTQFERAERLNDRAEKIQASGAKMVATARRAMINILPVIFFLLVYLSWLMLR